MMFLQQYHTYYSQWLRRQTCEMQPFYSYSQGLSFFTKITSSRWKAHCDAGLHILMLVCIGNVIGRGVALCWLCPDIHSHTISAVKKGCIRRPLHTDQRGVCRAAVGLLERLPTWKYHIPVLSRGAVCNCVLSDLQSPSHSFVPDIFLQWIYFSFFGILAAVPLVTKFSSFLPPCVLPGSDKSVWILHFVWEWMLTPSRKRSHPANDEQLSAPVL